MASKSADWATGLSRQIALAGISNAAAATCTNPMDVIKVRMQLHGEGVRAPLGRRGVVHTGSELLRLEGLPGLYRGLGASLCREMSYSGLRMGLYEPVKQALGATDPTNTPFALKVLAGAITGGTGSFLANPFDLVKVRMQSPKPASYPSVPAALREIASAEGLRGLWRGSGPTVQRAMLLTASQVPTYDHVKHMVVDGGHMKEGYLTHFCCSMVAGVVAAAVTSPVDLAKSRVMVQPICPDTGRGLVYGSVVDCLRKVASTEGPLALFKGFNGAWLRLGPHTTVSLLVFEELRRLAGMAYL